jgi:hypothetical protein
MMLFMFDDIHMSVCSVIGISNIFCVKLGA